MQFGDVALVHRDSQPPDDTRACHESVTALLYPNQGWESAYAGETVFFDEDDEEVDAVLPQKGRLLLFVASIKHCGRAPSRLFWGQRFTLAIKFVAAPRMRSGGGRNETIALPNASAKPKATIDDDDDDLVVLEENAMGDDENPLDALE